MKEADNVKFVLSNMCMKGMLAVNRARDRETCLVFLLATHCAPRGKGLRVRNSGATFGVCGLLEVTQCCPYLGSWFRAGLPRHGFKGSNKELYEVTTAAC